MFGFLRRRTREPIVFPDSGAAFRYACENLDNALLLEAVVPALVEERGRVGAEGERYFSIRLANRSGGRVIDACTLKEATDAPAVGDLVGFKVVRVEPELPEPFDLLGFIAYRLATVYVPGKGWPVERNYVPDNIKPMLRL
ncbi:hypothetical protein [Geobacter pickeringii]|uniref:Uncharacterized protein n=1 Tax=Geobacter pickeringii TaxID=345632 RepID=A0A0B5BJ04_9BACT|nr:hypothetical protein [Geobacter pickeringii]AJE04031.1 hypothetical protein GPICK_12285 [Geobacter pickeringii]